MTLDENPPNIGEALMARRLAALRPPKLNEAETTRVYAEILAASADLHRNPGRAAALREATAEVDRDRQRTRGNRIQRPRATHKPTPPVGSERRQARRTNASPRQRPNRAAQPLRRMFSWASETAENGSATASAMLLPGTVTILWMLPANIALTIVVVIVLASAIAWVCLLCLARTRPSFSERRQIVRDLGTALRRNRRDKDEPVA